MAIRRSDNVFLLTLVDFLIQIIFFGLIVFVFVKETEGKQRESFSPKQVSDALDAAGVSNIVELNDELSKLAPVRLKGFNERLHAGDQGTDMAKAADAIGKAGGAEGLSGAIERLAKLEQGAGKPACLYQSVNGSKQTITLASAVGSGSAITFQGETPELAKLLKSVGLRYSDVQSLSLGNFRRTFNRVLSAQPDCRYTIEFRETTRMVDARDAAGQIFYLKLRR
ncbi:hypothetical protein [Sphingobium baderi]|uniref:hypothetical protein n=1 Tax=Sphingobium baderi TaxID=1332080 RepID=UPI002B414E26|nr:hypothetical protein [Sphingobium baderi]WRD77199.1 hypothetical protein QQ987_03405 [Sphingobium baderi]